MKNNAEKPQATFPQILGKLIAMHDLTEREAAFAMQEIMEGKVNNPQIAAFLTALKAKGETVSELAAFARAMRERTLKVKCNGAHLVDTCGTGGDASGTFNISTCAAFVAAGSGATVAKHGNRAASGKSGSADVLEALGIDINADAKKAKAQLEKIGIAFMFAPIYHPAMKHVAQVRKELGFRTVFNMLGPLTNPAGVKKQVIGVPSRQLAKKLAGVARRLGAQKAIFVASDIDEISVSATTHVYEATKSGIKTYSIKPEDFGMKRSVLGKIKVDGSNASAKLIIEVLRGTKGPARDVVLLNAAAAIYASGLAKNMLEGAVLAKKSIDSGSALAKLEALRNFSGA